MPVQEQATTQADSHLLLVGVFVSLFVALYILRLLMRVWGRAQRDSGDREQSGLLNSGAGSARSDFPPDNRAHPGDKALSQGQSFKFWFLVGLFLTNAGRCLVLIYDWSSHALFGQDEAEAGSSTAELAFTELPTLFLMTSFSLFVYYIAQLTIQLELSKLGLFGK